jgi:outer membrane protein
MWSKNKFTIQFFIFLVIVIGWIIYQKQSEDKTGFIYIQEVYNGFDMKKEIEQRYTVTKNARDKILDSLELDLKLLARKIESEGESNKETIALFNIRREEFVSRKQTYEEDNVALTKKYDQEILSQLNQYVKDFGLKNDFTYVFGNDGNGSLMYAKETKDVTKEVIEFINNKYKGVE